jgi:hypothetical protein
MRVAIILALIVFSLVVVRCASRADAEDQRLKDIPIRPSENEPIEVGRVTVVSFTAVSRTLRFRINRDTADADDRKKHSASLTPNQGTEKAASK